MSDTTPRKPSDGAATSRSPGSERDQEAASPTSAPSSPPSALRPPSSGLQALRPSDHPTILPFRVPAFLPWAIAAGLALAAGWLTLNLLSTQEDAVILRTELQFAEIARRDAENHLKAEHIVLNQAIANATQLLADTSQKLAATSGQVAGLDQRIADLDRQLKAQGDLAQFRIATLTSTPGNPSPALGVAVWNPARQEGVFTVDKLAAADADSDYEFWLIDPAQAKPVSGGVFTVGADGQARVQFKPEAPVAKIAQFAVSREKKGGAPRLSGPQGAVIMISP